MLCQSKHTLYFISGSFLVNHERVTFAVLDCRKESVSPATQ